MYEYGYSKENRFVKVRYYLRRYIKGYRLEVFDKINLSLEDLDKYKILACADNIKDSLYCKILMLYSGQRTYEDMDITRLVGIHRGLDIRDVGSREARNMKRYSSIRHIESDFLFINSGFGEVEESMKMMNADKVINWVISYRKSIGKHTFIFHNGLPNSWYLELTKQKWGIKDLGKIFIEDSKTVKKSEGML